MNPNESKKRSPILVLSAIGLAVISLGLLLNLRRHHPEGEPQPPPAAATNLKKYTANWPTARTLHRPATTSADTPSPEAIVAKKLTQFAAKQRAIFETMAAKHNVAVSDEVKRFFDAVAAGNYEEAKAIYKSLVDPTNPSGSQSSELRPIWRSIQDTWGAMQQTHDLPAQKVLDYGNSILDSLRPGMIYVGGSDPGIFIPNMLNSTSEGEQHIVLTQNALADGTYLNYLQELYGDRLNNLTSTDSQKSFNDYFEDAKKRHQHDQDFPDEPKQVRPGEDLKMKDGKLTISGQTAVMAINERLLQTLMQKNPDLSFGMEESFSLPSTYTGALPLGPIMELRATDSQTAFTADVATQTVNYWNTTAQKLLSDPEATGSSDTMLLYSHEIAAHANLLAARDFSAQAEQAYNLASQLAPTNFGAISGLTDLLNHTGRSEQAIQILNDFAQKNPNQQKAVDRQRIALGIK